MSRSYDQLLGHVSDGIEEYDNPLPRWWLFLFYGTIAFAAIYSIMYPSWWFWGGTQGWTSGNQYEANLAEFNKLHPDAGWADVGKLAQDPKVVEAGVQIFRIRCVPCHGMHAEGKIGPSLIDKEWKYGGEPADILKTIRFGRPLGMPAWGKMIKKEEVETVAAFIVSLKNDPEHSPLGPPDAPPPGAATPGAPGAATPAAPATPGPATRPEAATPGTPAATPGATAGTPTPAAATP